MDLALSSSTVLGAAVLVWLLWVAPYLTRRRRAERPAGEAALLMESGGQGAPEATVRAGAAGPPSSAPAPAVEGIASPGAGPAREGSTAPLRIRWGRMSVALVGLVSGLAVPVTLVLLVVGLPGWVPAVCAAGAAAAVATLRALAMRDRKRRVDAAFRSAMRATDAEPLRPSPPRGPSEVFDAGPDPEPAPRAMTHGELRAFALEVAKASQAAATAEAKATGAPEEWEPVEVPKPGYVEAAKAERPDPAPLEAPADPKPEGRPALKPKPDSPEPGTVPGVPAIAPRPAARAGALGNLDEVLNRRRA